MESTANQCFVVGGPLKMIPRLESGSVSWVLARQGLKLQSGSPVRRDFRGVHEL